MRIDRFQSDWGGLLEAGLVVGFEVQQSRAKKFLGT